MSTTAPASGSALSNEREIEIAELETRIRRFNLELMQPTIRRATSLEQEIQALRAEFQRSTLVLSDLARTSTKVEEQVVVVESFREEMNKWDSERRAVQAHIAESISNMKQDMDTFRYSLERKDSTIHSQQRTMDRVVGELSKLQETGEALRQQVDYRLNQQSQTINIAKTDLETQLVELQSKHNRLSDELWGEETGLARATANITNTNNLVMSLREEIQRMHFGKADVAQLEQVQDDVNELIRDANSNVTTLKQTVDTMVNDVKQHFKIATNTVAAHNATMIAELRSSYQEELSNAAKLRTEVGNFMRDTKKHIGTLENSVKHGHEQTSEMVKKVSSDVEKVSGERKRDNSMFEVCAQTMQEQLSRVYGSSETVARALEHLSSVISTMLESDRIASALSVQDDDDRAKVALIGYKDNKGSVARPTSTSMARRSGGCGHDGPSRGGGGGAGPGKPPVISVDTRCLSCSGQAQHVLSGFKMACLQYAPGDVHYCKRLWRRDELLEKRQQLLAQANDQLEYGPVSLQGISPAPQAPPQAASIESVSPQLPSRTSEMVEQERPSSRSSSGSGAMVRSTPRALPPLSPVSPMTSSSAGKIQTAFGAVSVA